MVSSKLAGHPAYIRGQSSARKFVLGSSLAEREEGLRGLGLLGFPLDIARKVIAIDDWGPRVVGLSAAANYHAHMGEGAMGAAIAVVVRELFGAAADRAPEELRNIARQAIASVATDFSYGVLRAGYPDDAVAWADGLTPKLLDWRKTDVGLTVETLAAEALWTTNCFDAAIARRPNTGPSDEAGRLRYERLSRLIDALRPDAPDPEAPAVQYVRALSALATLQQMIPNTPAYAAMREKIANVLKTERERALPDTEDDLLERATSLIELLKEAQEAGIGGV